MFLTTKLHSDPQDKLPSCKELERPHKILPAGRHVLPGTATGTISGKLRNADGNKHPVQHAGLVAPGKHNRFSTLRLMLLMLLLLRTNLVDKACEGVLCGYILDSKAYRIYKNRMGRATESRNGIFIENRESRKKWSTATSANSGGISTHGDSSLAETRTTSVSLTTMR